MSKILTHTRFLLTLRSDDGLYRSLLLFRLAASSVSASEKLCDEGEPMFEDQIYVMESACPHLGADLSHADIEEAETGVVAVCPWHR